MRRGDMRQSLAFREPISTGSQRKNTKARVTQSQSWQDEWNRTTALNWQWHAQVCVQALAVAVAASYESRGKVTESSNPRASQMWPPPWLSPRCLTLGTFRMLSQTLQPLSHALPLILYHHHLTSSSSRVTSTLLIAYQSKFHRKLVVIASRISTIQRRTNE